jgi:hypothetical protein
MTCPKGTSGEGMPLRFYLGRTASRTLPVSLLASAALIGLAVTVNSAARAGDDDGTEAQASAWSKFMQTLGLKKKPDAAGAEAGIVYTERSPLVVPSNRDLPAPVASDGVPADWPSDQSKQVKHVKAKLGLVPGTAVDTPNPPHEKKPWYNPAGWFDKEEYAKFAGEPGRQDLTDPPAGYRIPSPDQPYGIAPDKKAAKASVANPTGQGPK